MKATLVVFGFIFSSLLVRAQTCDEIMEYVKSQDYGTSYSSYTSEAIQKVTFYTITVDYQYRYFAVVCFKTQTYGCKEYIYQVAHNTRMNYSINYLNSAGKAFWTYIHPYRKTLGCAPDFE